MAAISSLLLRKRIHTITVKHLRFFLESYFKKMILVKYRIIEKLISVDSVFPRIFKVDKPPKNINVLHESLFQTMFFELYRNAL